MDRNSLQTRIPYIDMLRIVACMMVLLIHAPMYKVSQHTPSVSFATYLLLFTVSSKLFFMLTGALLIPVKLGTKAFLKRRLSVLLLPLAVWSLIYLLEHIFILHDFDVRMLWSVLFNPVDETLWFVYVMVGVYLILPIMSRCVEAIGRRGVEFVLILWILSSLIPYEQGMFLSPKPTHHMLSGFANYFGYVLMGYYLHNYPLPIFTRRHWWKFAAVAFVGIVVIPLFEFLVQPHFGVTYAQAIDTITHDISINDVFLSILTFSAVKHFAPERYDDGKPHRTGLLITRMAVCSYGIYLGHMLVMRNMVWPFMIAYLPNITHTVVLGVITAVLSFIVTYLVMWILNITPMSKAFLGRERYRKARKEVRND